MVNRVILNNVDHADLRVLRRHAPEYGDAINQVLIFPTEFEDVQREYPILFRRDAEGAYQAVALLGLDRDENLFLDDRGWQARYVPAVQQRGPFSIVMQGSDGATAAPMVHIDLDDPRVGTQAGEPLFLPHGGNTPYLEHVAAVLRSIYTGLELAGPMFDAFEAFGLMQPVSLDIELSDVQRYHVPDCYTIAQDRLAELDGAALEQLNRGGFLYPAFLAVASLANVQRLIALKNARIAAQSG